MTWNVRWLRDPHTVASGAKRAIINRNLQAGNPVLLQETHWDEAQEGILAGLFPHATVCASSTPGNAHRPLAGVA
eukprot:2116399-Prorocentrum_lima.AAC.1